MPDRSLFTNHHGLHPLPHPPADGSDGFVPREVEIEVEVDGAWVRGLAYARRRVGEKWEVQIRSVHAPDETGQLASGWFGGDRIRAVHIKEPDGHPRVPLI
jgi:hypothetical protein